MEVDELATLHEMLRDAHEKIMKLEKTLAYYELLLAAKSTRHQDLMAEGING